MSGLFEVVALILLAEILIRLSSRKSAEPPATCEPPAPTPLEQPARYIWTHSSLPAPSIMREYDEETRREIEEWYEAKERERAEKQKALSTR